jgi:hypothetical protein
MGSGYDQQTPIPALRDVPRRRRSFDLIASQGLDCSEWASSVGGLAI